MALSRNMAASKKLIASWKLLGTQGLPLPLPLTVGLHSLHAEEEEEEEGEEFLPHLPEGADPLPHQLAVPRPVVPASLPHPLPRP